MFEFGNKGTQSAGVLIDLQLNLSSLSDMNIPTVENMSRAWLPNNCARQRVGIAALNLKNGVGAFVTGPSGIVHIDMKFDVPLDFPVGPQNAKSFQVSISQNLIFFSVADLAFMAFPAAYFDSLLSGKAIVDYGDARKNMSGVKSEASMKIYAPNAEYSLPAVETVAEKWFKFENTAAKVLVSVIDEKTPFPLVLGEQASA